MDLCDSDLKGVSYENPAGFGGCRQQPANMVDGGCQISLLAQHFVNLEVRIS